MWVAVGNHSIFETVHEILARFFIEIFGCTCRA